MFTCRGDGGESGRCWVSAWGLGLMRSQVVFPHCAQIAVHTPVHCDQNASLTTRGLWSSSSAHDVSNVSVAHNVSNIRSGPVQTCQSWSDQVIKVKFATTKCQRRP